MSADLVGNQITNARHNDKDLVQHSGYHTYRKYGKWDVIQVNGKVSLVENVETNSSTGLNALVRNITSLTKNGSENFAGELIIYVRSQQLVGDWINANINLIEDVYPVRLKATILYFEEVEAKFIKISI